MKRQIRMAAFLALMLAAPWCLTAQTSWMDGGRKQSMWQKGNGALLVHDGVMYFWNEENHFQISTDNGTTWSDPPDSIGGANPHVVKMSAAGDRVYAALNFGTGQGIPIYSTDMGVTWQPDTLGAPGHALGWEGRPVVSNIIAWGRWVMVKWDQPVPFTIKTLDGEWKSNDYINTGGNRPSSWVASGDTLFLASTKVYYTTDGGETFTVPANNGYPGMGGQLIRDGRRLYLFTYKSFTQPAVLLYSDDNAENWNEIDVSSLTSKTVLGGSMYFPVDYFIRGERIEFAAVAEEFNTPPNVWKSPDLGKTWERDTAGLPTRYVNGVVGFAYTPDGTLWVVPSHENIYRQKIDEGTGGGNQVTAAPALLSPQQGVQVALPSRFIWNSVPNAERYHLQIATDTTFASTASDGSDGSLMRASSSTILVDQTNVADTSMTIFTIPAAPIYYWRVRGIGEGDQAGPWSGRGSFTISTSTVPQQAEKVLHVGPIPCREYLRVEFPAGAMTSFELRDLLGSVVQSGDDLRSRSSLALDVRQLAAGSYWLVVREDSGEAHVSPVVVQ